MCVCVCVTVDSYRTLLFSTLPRWTGVSAFEWGMISHPPILSSEVRSLWLVGGKEREARSVLVREPDVPVC